MHTSEERTDEDAALVMLETDEVPEIPKSMRQLEVLISAGT